MESSPSTTLVLLAAATGFAKGHSVILQSILTGGPQLDQLRTLLGLHERTLNPTTDSATPFDLLFS